jgi:enamine deaminase RidA (YjgF/YER057c/UK114 family)
MKAASAQLSDVIQLTIYMAGAVDMKAIDSEYRRAFGVTRPNALASR